MKVRRCMQEPPEARRPVLPTWLNGFSPQWSIFPPASMLRSRIPSPERRSAACLAFLDSRRPVKRSEEHTSELQSLMRISYAVFCLQKKKQNNNQYKRKQKETKERRTHA